MLRIFSALHKNGGTIAVFPQSHLKCDRRPFERDIVKKIKNIDILVLRVSHNQKENILILLGECCNTIVPKRLNLHQKLTF